jgi:hypothetical protein
MPDNRRRHANTVPIAKFIVFLVAGGFACAAGLGYMWCKNQLYTTGQQIKKYEEELRVLKSRNEVARANIARLTSTDELQKRFNSGFIKMAHITGEHIVVVTPKTTGPGELRTVVNERKQE